MGTYYGVRKVVEIGQRIDFPLEGDPLGIGDDVLVGIMNNGVWAIAPDLTRKSEYQDYYDSYSRGMWLNMYLYKVPKDKIKDCPDEGRVPVADLEQLLKANSSK